MIQLGGQGDIHWDRQHGKMGMFAGESSDFKFATLVSGVPETAK